MPARRFPPPWSVEDIGACFDVVDSAESPKVNFHNRHERSIAINLTALVMRRRVIGSTMVMAGVAIVAIVAIDDHNRGRGVGPVSHIVGFRISTVVRRVVAIVVAVIAVRRSRRNTLIGNSAARISQLHLPDPMRSCSEPATSSRISSRFQRRLPGGRHDLIFRVVFGSDAAAARSLRRSKMTIWRWRHDRSPPPKWVIDILVDLVQRKVADACAARQELNYLRQLPPNPPRPCRAVAGYSRKPNWTF
jgi:hypothetical protein